MKKFLILLLSITSYLSAQSWKGIVTTSINVPLLQDMELFSNKDGNHLIIQTFNPSSIKYYLLNSSGNVIRSSTIVTGDVSYPNISGSNEKVHMTYKNGNYIVTKYSTNAGQSWQDATPIQLTQAINGVDAVYDYRGLHVVWSEYSPSTYGDEVKYYKYNPSSYALEDFKNVTDATDEFGDEYGRWPSVTVSSNKVHVGYNYGNMAGIGKPKTRDKEFTTGWQTAQFVLDDANYSMTEKVFSNGSILFNFYYQYFDDFGGAHSDLYVRKRAVNDNSWSSPVFLKSFINYQDPVSVTKSADSKTHIVYEGVGSTVYRNFNGSTWSNELTIGDNYYTPRMSSVSNDLFVVYKGSNNYIKYRQYDANPLAPQNLTFSLNPGDNHIRLQWDANSEPDLSLYEISRKVNEGSWSVVTTTTNTYWVDPNWAYNGSAFDVSYRLRAKDVNNHYSGFSNTVTCHPYPMGKESPNLASSNTPKEFLIQQNFPNPFNPSTRIQYTVPQDSKFN